MLSPPTNLTNPRYGLRLGAAGAVIFYFCLLNEEEVQFGRFIICLSSKLRFTEFGGPTHERPVQDLAFAVARFIQRGGSFVNYYMVCLITNQYHGFLFLFFSL